MIHFSRKTKVWERSAQQVTEISRGVGSPRRQRHPRMDPRRHVITGSGVPRKGPCGLGGPREASRRGGTVIPSGFSQTQCREGCSNRGGECGPSAPCPQPPVASRASQKTNEADLNPAARKPTGPAGDASPGPVLGRFQASPADAQRPVLQGRDGAAAGSWPERPGAGGKTSLSLETEE